MKNQNELKKLLEEQQQFKTRENKLKLGYAGIVAMALFIFMSFLLNSHTWALVIVFIAFIIVCFQIRYYERKLNSEILHHNIKLGSYGQKVYSEHHYKFR